MNIRLTKEQKIKILNSTDISEIMKKILFRENKIGRKKEYFWVVGLATNSRIMYIELVSLGSLSKAVVDPMEVYSLAVQKKSPQIILIHNHLSGELRPSKEDKKLTRELVQGGKLLNITVLDHLIISEEDFLSFAYEGILPK